jgi:hypothetical protein
MHYLCGHKIAEPFFEHGVCHVRKCARRSHEFCQQLPLPIGRVGAAVPLTLLRFAMSSFWPRTQNCEDENIEDTKKKEREIMSKEMIIEKWLSTRLRGRRQRKNNSIEGEWKEKNDEKFRKNIIMKREKKKEENNDEHNK